MVFIQNENNSKRRRLKLVSTKRLQLGLYRGWLPGSPLRPPSYPYIGALRITQKIEPDTPTEKQTMLPRQGCVDRIESGDRVSMWCLDTVF